MGTMFFSERGNCSLCGQEKMKSHGLCVYCLERLEFVYGREKTGQVYTDYFLFANDFFRSYFYSFKFFSKTYLAVAFARLLVMEGEKRNLFKNVDAIIPIPMHPEEQRQRGYNQVLLLAEEVYKMTGIPVYGTLKKIRETKRQHHLSLRDRRENVKDAFCFKGENNGKRFLLLDDFVTTGSTMEEAAKAVLKGNGRIAGAMALASTTHPMFP